MSLEVDIGRRGLVSNWQPLVHQDGGGTASGHVLAWGDQNMDIQADHIGVQSTDASVAMDIEVSGTPTEGEQPGIQLTVNDKNYTIAYTVQSADTNASVAFALASGFSQSPAANVSVAPNTFYDDLLSHGYAARSGNNGSSIYLDLPWGLTTVCSGVNSSHTTVTSNSPLTANLDNGPFVYAAKLVNGRTPVVNDAIGWYRGDSQSTATSGYDTQYGGLKIRVGQVSATSPEGTASLEGCGSGNKGSQPLLSVQASLGAWVEDGTGQSNPNRAYGGGPGHFSASVLHARSGALALAGVPFASAPAVGTALQCITDSTTSTVGAVVSGGGANTVLAWYNGTNWKVVMA